MLEASIFTLISLLFGFWAKPNVHQRQYIRYHFLLLVSMFPLSLLFGYSATIHFELPYWLSMVPGCIGFSCAKPLEAMMRKKLRIGTGNTAQYFEDLAKKEGEEFKILFMRKALELHLKDLQSGKQGEPSVDSLIKGYYAAREEAGLPQIVINEKNIPFV